MAAFIFGEKIDFNIVPNPDTGGFVIGYDLDGVLKQKDEFGVITKIGGGSGNLSSVLAQGNNSGTYSIVLDNGSYITNNTSTNKINLNNSAISLTTDNELYIESYLYLTATDAILANGSSSFRIEGNAVKLIYDVNNNQIITNNSYKLKVNNSNVLEFGYGGLTAGPGSRANAIISSDGSIINTNLINTVVIGGSNITASQSNSVYVPSLYVQDSKFIRGTNGSVFMSGKSVIGIQESTSTILTNNGILLKDTATQSTSPNLDSGITYISSKNSRNSAGIKNTVVVGGTNINATASDTVYLGNKVNINNVYTLPTTDGSPGQIIKTDGSGNLTWGTQDSGAAIALNYVQFRADYENNILAKNATYLITDADKSLYDSVNGTSIYLSTDGYGNVLESVYGKFWNPKYDKNITGYGIFDPSTTYNQNDIAIWGGYYWTRITPTPGVDTVVDIFNLDSNWVKQPFGNTYYNLSYDSIIYDIDNNKIVSRSDNNNNTVITSNENIYYWINTMSLNNPIKAFQWGNAYDGTNGISGNIIVDSYNENINFIGLFQTDMNFVNKSYQSNIVFGPSASQSNFLFSNSSYQNNIVFAGASSQINITLNNNSSQENLDDVSNSYTQDGLSLNNFNSDRTSIPLSDNESFTAIGNDVVIDGNLRVTGTTSTINSINLTIQDSLILLAASQSGAPTLDSGLIIERGSLDNTAFIWDESNDEFVFISTNDDASVSGDVNIIGYENLRANSYIVDGGLSTEFLKADGSLDPTTYAVDSTVVHIYGTESIIGFKTITPVVNTTGFSIDMPAVTNAPTGGVPDAMVIYTRGHNGSSNSSVDGVNIIPEGNKNIGYVFNNYNATIDVTNSTGVEIIFKTSSTTNTIIRGKKGNTTVFNVDDNGDLIATTITKIGGLTSQFLKADGSVDSNVYLTFESDTLQTVTGRGSTTTANITSNGFIKTGGTSVQFLKADGSVDGNTYALDSNVIHKTGNETKNGSLCISNGGSVVWLSDNPSIAAVYINTIATSATAAFRTDISSTTQHSFQVWGGGLSTSTAYSVINGGGSSVYKVNGDGSVTAKSYIKTGGTSTQFLKADGSSDGTVYAVDGNVVHKTGNETILGDKIFSNSAGTTGVTFQNNVDYGGNYAIEGYCFAGGQGVARFTHNGGASSTYNLDLRNNSGGTNLKLSTGGSTSGLAIVSENNSHVSTFSLDINGNVTGNSFVKTGGTSAQFLKANGTVDSNVYLTTLTDTLQTVTTRGATTTTSITANSFIKTGGNSTQYLMADGSVSGAITFTETDTLQSVTTRGATTTQPITMNPIANVTGLFVDMEAVDNFPTIGVPDAIRSNIRGHNGTSSSLNCGFYATMQGNKCGGLFVENTATISDATNSIAVDVSFKATSTTNTIFRGRKGGSTVFGVTDNGDLTATSISKIGGTAFEHLMADGSTMEISPQVTISASTVYLDDSFHGKIVKVKGASTIFVPGSLRAGFNCVFRVFTSANALFLGTQSGVIESSGQNLTAGKMATMFKDTDTSFTYVIAGDLT